MNQKILITGGTGFVGQHLTQNLLSVADEIELHLTTYSKDQNNLLGGLGQAQVQIHSLDLTDVSATTELFDQVRPDQVYHLAAIPIVGGSFKRAGEIMNNNTQLQLSLFQAISDLKINPRVLIVGSAEEYGVSLPNELPINERHPLRPVNPYAVSKVAQDLLGYAFFVSHGIEVIRVRPFNHIGAGQADQFVVAAFAKQIALIEKGQQSTMAVGNLKTIRDFTDVRDMVKAYTLLMTKGRPGEVYNVGRGQGVTIATILDNLIKLTKVEVKVVVNQALLRESDVPQMVADNRKISQLGWRPEIELNQTLEWVLNDWRKRV